MSSPRKEGSPQQLSKSPNRQPQSSQRKNSSPASHSRSRERQRQPTRQQSGRPFDLQRQQYKERSQGLKVEFDRQERGVSGRVEEDRSHFKTRICPLYEKGLCRKGEGCSFAHGEKELRGLPNFKKTRLCIPFKNGQCPRSSADCNYAHGEAQIKKLAYDYFPEKRREVQRPYQHRGYDHSHRDNYRTGTRDEHRSSRQEHRGPRNDREEERREARKDQYRRDQYRREGYSRDEYRSDTRRDEYRRDDYRRDDYRRDEYRREHDYRREDYRSQAQRKDKYRRDEYSYNSFPAQYNNAYNYPYPPEDYPQQYPPQAYQYMGGYDYYYYPQNYPSANNTNNSSSVRQLHCFSFFCLPFMLETASTLILSHECQSLKEWVFFHLDRWFCFLGQEGTWVIL